MIIAPVEASADWAYSKANYYPFGMKFMNSFSGANPYRYGYQGEYAEDETDQDGIKVNSFQLRLYNPRLGRWMSPDPYGQFHSPYLAMGNNPISMVDPDGGWCYDPNTGEQVPCGDLASIFGNDENHTTLFQETNLIHYNEPSYDNNIININKSLNGVNEYDLMEKVEAKLIKNGVSENTEVRPSSSMNYGVVNSFNIWKNDIEVANVNIRNFDGVTFPEDNNHKKAAGYSRLGSNVSVVFRGLHPVKPERYMPMRYYVSTVVHELGHAIFEFSHEPGTGHTDNDCNIMDYRAPVEADFSDENIQFIKSSKWGSQ